MPNSSPCWRVQTCDHNGKWHDIDEHCSQFDSEQEAALKAQSWWSEQPDTSEPQKSIWIVAPSAECYLYTKDGPVQFSITFHNGLIKFSRPH